MAKNILKNLLIFLGLFFITIGIVCYIKSNNKNISNENKELSVSDFKDAKTIGDVINTEKYNVINDLELDKKCIYDYDLKKRNMFCFDVLKNNSIFEEEKRKIHSTNNKIDILINNYEKSDLSLDKIIEENNNIFYEEGFTKYNYKMISVEKNNVHFDALYYIYENSTNNIRTKLIIYHNDSYNNIFVEYLSYGNIFSDNLINNFVNDITVEKSNDDVYFKHKEDQNYLIGNLKLSIKYIIDKNNELIMLDNDNIKTYELNFKLPKNEYEEVILSELENRIDFKKNDDSFTISVGLIQVNSTYDDFIKGLFIDNNFVLEDDKSINVNGKTVKRIVYTNNDKKVIKYGMDINKQFVIEYEFVTDKSNELDYNELEKILVFDYLVH